MLGRDWLFPHGLDVIFWTVLVLATLAFATMVLGLAVGVARRSRSKALLSSSRAGPAC